MSTVSIHPPKTPVTKGCHSVAKATLPNVCKMPGPPAPFVPSPLPNIAKSELSPKGYSTTVEIEGAAVAIRGATYESIGDMASKGTGGGLISANTHGPAKFITPGSLTVKIEGKSVHLLGEQMLNNCGPSGSPPNTGATMMGTKHAKSKPQPDNEKDIKCAIHECDNKSYSLKGVPKADRCKALGQQKHNCVANHPKVKGKEPAIYSETFVDMANPTNATGANPMLSSAGAGVKSIFQAMWHIGKTVATYVKGALRRPDLMYVNNAGRRVVADAKFPCPASTPVGPAVMPSPTSAASMLTGVQQADYKIINGGKNPQEIQPSDCKASDCT
jgi:uncharacterized Zn-binding protein involved in type VI secretion